MQNLLNFVSFCSQWRSLSVILLDSERWASLEDRRGCAPLSNDSFKVCMNKASLLGSAEVYSRCTEEASRRSHCNTRLFAEVQKGRFVLL